ncbi:hypothetical protein K466DRAFT_598280 [Polyporus arcularius HHB13444]|uniref:Uncharacterized protein n=1 Tax=Polyporus arcularius HHB13444 TaxID=1314778 RepID=A0A5C3PGJ5_9APHY|nr:hypothetical protein K466DRAFT_598280 [Polyporus arcularius HHB13444]
MSSRSRSRTTQHERHVLRTEASTPRLRPRSNRPALLGQPKPSGLSLKKLLTCPGDQLRDDIANFDEPIHRQIDTPYLILRLNVTWPGHSVPEIEASKRLRQHGCHCLGQLAVEVAKECQDTLKGFLLTPTVAAKRVFEVENLTLVALYYVEEPGGLGTYYADVESTSPRRLTADRTILSSFFANISWEHSYYQLPVVDPHPRYGHIVFKPELAIVTAKGRTRMHNHSRQRVSAEDP